MQWKICCRGKCDFRVLEGYALNISPCPDTMFSGNWKIAIVPKNISYLQGMTTIWVPQDHTMFTKYFLQRTSGDVNGVFQTRKGGPLFVNPDLTKL